MTRMLRVCAPCRLHFGMFSFGHEDRAQFGGVGAMVNPPSIEVTVSPASKFSVTGTLAERAQRFVALALAHWQVRELPNCAMVINSPPDHVGLGVGTQLGLAVARALRGYLRLPELPAAELAISVGRGRRSAIGTYGFERGGFIVDAGKQSGASLGALAQRLALPEAWRFVLVRPGESKGLAGEVEAGAFGRLRPVPDGVTRDLWRIVDDEMLPAIRREDCESFGDAVYRFGRLAGECFAMVQGGAFGSAEAARLVADVRTLGVSGVGQSSWGPTIFAITPNETEAENLVERLWVRGLVGAGAISIAQPNNCGAMVGRHPATA